MTRIFFAVPLIIVLFLNDRSLMKACAQTRQSAMPISTSTVPPETTFSPTTTSMTTRTTGTSTTTRPSDEFPETTKRSTPASTTTTIPTTTTTTTATTTTTTSEPTTTTTTPSTTTTTSEPTTTTTTTTTTTSTTTTTTTPPPTCTSCSTLNPLMQSAVGDGINRDGRAEITVTIVNGCEVANVVCFADGNRDTLVQVFTGGTPYILNGGCGSAALPPNLITCNGDGNWVFAVTGELNPSVQCSVTTVGPDC